METSGNFDPQDLRLSGYRWLAAGLALGLVIVHQALGRPWSAGRPGLVAALLVDGFILLAGAAAWVGIDRWRQAQAEHRNLQARLQANEQSAARAYARLELASRAGEMFAEASDEKEVVEQFMQVACELAGARSASFVPLDERGQTLPALSFGELPYPAVDAWVEYLASPTVREGCQACQNHEHLTLNCPLLQGSFAGTAGVYCIPVRRGAREYGVLNLYLPLPGELDLEAQAILRTIVDETTLALEGVRLRQRELDTLRQLQAVRERTDLKAQLSGLPDTLKESLEADFALVVVWDGDPQRDQETLSSSELPAKARPLIDGLLHSVMASGRPLLLGSVAGETATALGFRALMAAPLTLPDHPPLGALVVANRGARAFNPRQLSTLQTIAGQVAMAAHIADRFAELEFTTRMDERTRLAREIHDGLAQTLGFLKLKTAQMLNYLNHNDLETLRKTLQVAYESLSEAYLDVRQAIDGLRISSFENGLAGWLRQTVKEFGEYSELEVHLCEPVADPVLPPEIHAQLIRIVQEALANIRKHAQAQQAWVSSELNTGDLILEVRDDGRGFSPADTPGDSQHGLRGMRERAELIGADFQIIGGPQRGTTVRLRLPLDLKEGVR